MSNCTEILAVKPTQNPSTTLQAQLQDLLLPYAPQFFLLQQDRTTIHKVQPELQVGSEILPTVLLPSPPLLQHLILLKTLTFHMTAHNTGVEFMS